jgi:DNA polymerase-1
MFSFSMCDEKCNISVYRLDNNHRQAMSILRQLFHSARKDGGKNEIVMHNSKFDLSFTEKALGCRLAETICFHDTMIMSHMLRNDHRGHALKDLAWELAGIPKDDEAEVRKYAKNMEDVDYSRVPEHVMKRYQELDAKRAMVLCAFFLPKIKERPKLYDCYQWECDAIIPTLRMEQHGFMIHRQRTTVLRDEMEADAKAAMDEAEKIYGRRINIGNDNVLRQVLYTEKQLPILGRTKTTGAPSVEKEVLDTLFQQTHDPLLRLAVRYKSRRRGSTVLQSYLDAADNEGTIHPNIRTLGAVTGRESCSNPNLQNVEKEGRLQNPFPTPARKAFRPRPDCVNFHVDYAGIELRLLVHYSKDQELVDEISKPDGDPHYVAAQIFYPPIQGEERKRFADFCKENPVIAAGIDAFPKKSKEWIQLRDPAKNTNFAVPYGAGWQKASGTLGLPLALGEQRFIAYRKRFPNLCSMTHNIISTVKSRGGVETAFGRFLYVPKEKAYVGVNFLIQGTAAEILKRSQVRVQRYLEEVLKGQCHLILPIHDELIIEWPRKLLAQAPQHWRELRRLMIDFPQFDVPLDVAVDVTTVDWAHKKQFNFMEKS